MSTSLLLLDDFFDRRPVVGVFVDVSGPPFLLFLRDFEDVDVGLGGSWEGPAESPGLDITAGVFPFGFFLRFVDAVVADGGDWSASVIFCRFGRLEGGFADSGSGAGLASR